MMMTGNTYKTNLSKAIKDLEQVKNNRDRMVNKLCEMFNSLEENDVPDISIEDINKMYKDIAIASLHIKGLEDGISEVSESIKVIVENGTPIPRITIDKL